MVCVCVCVCVFQEEEKGGIDGRQRLKNAICMDQDRMKSTHLDLNTEEAVLGRVKVEHGHFRVCHSINQLVERAKRHKSSP